MKITPRKFFGIAAVAIGLFALSLDGPVKNNGGIELTLQNNCSAATSVKIKSGSNVREVSVKTGSMVVYTAPGAVVLNSSGKTLCTLDGSCGHKKTVVVCE
jgi:hypothetical protein